MTAATYEGFTSLDVTEARWTPSWWMAALLASVLTLGFVLTISNVVTTKMTADQPTTQPTVINVAPATQPQPRTPELISTPMNPRPPPATLPPPAVDFSRDDFLTHLANVEGGVQLQPYDDGAGHLTIGVGHKITGPERQLAAVIIDDRIYPYGDGITNEQAIALWEQDIAWAEAVIDQSVDVALSDGQRAALVSFVFNIGGPQFRSSTLLQKLNDGNYAAVPDQMRRWVKGGKPPETKKSLQNRREKEIQLWKM